MRTRLRVALLASATLLPVAMISVWPKAFSRVVERSGTAVRESSGDVRAASGAVVYGKDGTLVAPRDYREWIFLSSGVDMVYGPKAGGGGGHSMFDNVFVDPASYRSFLADGTWPDKTVMVLEIRGAETNASINRGGHSQGGAVMGMEIHVKDASRFPGGWAFFDVNDAGVGTLIAKPAGCYTCHEEHAAVDTTFVQFYPTLLPVAKGKGTLSAVYLKEFGAAQAGK